MDLKDFQNVQNDDGVTAGSAVPKSTKKDGAKVSKSTQPLVDSEFHDESHKIIKELEARIAAINSDKNVETTADIKDVSPETEEAPVPEEDVETVVVKEGEGESFLDKIKPFILPICLTLFALLFAGLFMYFFSKSRVERSAQAIINNQSQPEVIILKEEKPKVQEVVVVPEKVIPTCNKDTQILNEETNECEDLPPPPEETKFENGTTTIVKVRFSYDKINYDNFPRGIYLLEEQIFGKESEYTDFKLLPTSRPYANDAFFGIDRYMVSLLGACQYVVDEADILVSNMTDSSGDREYSAIKDRYFRGKVEKIISSSKPHIVCAK